MKRFVGLPLDRFELIFADETTANVEEAAYPPCCKAASGPLRFRRARAGGMILDVRRCGVESSGDFRLDMLFTTGSGPFADAVDLARFLNGPVADAFGLPRGPLPARAQQSLLDDLYETLPPSAPRRGKSRSARERRRMPSSPALAKRLARVVRGQEVALQWLSSLIVSQLAKRAPRRPATVLLIGPTGVGKTTTVEALPAALAAEGWYGAHVHRIDCNELTDDYDVHRFLGSAPGLVGYTESPPLLTALAKDGCLVLLDEIDKAHPAVQEAMYSLLDRGRVMTPGGAAVSAPGTVVAMTSAAGADELASRLHRVVPNDRRLVDRTAREHLREHGWSAELVGRIDTIAVYQPLPEAARRDAAVQAIQTLADEYGLAISSLEPVITDVVLDIADDLELGVRGLYYAARQLLGETFATALADEVGRTVIISAGPPPLLLPAG